MSGDPQRPAPPPSRSPLGSMSGDPQRPAPPPSRSPLGSMSGDPQRPAPPPSRSPLAPAALLARWWERTFGAQSRGMFGQCVDQRADCGGIGLDIHPQAEFGGGLGGFGADAGDNGPRVRLTGDG